jgi:hypothetical protein
VPIAPPPTRTRVLLIVLAVVSIVALFTTRVSRKMPDFEVYRVAAARALDGAPLYRASDGHYQFKYLPSFALLVSPLALVPAATAKALWFGGSAVLMLILLGLSVRAQPRLSRPPALLVVLTFLAMAKFYAHELVLGQANLLFAVVVTLALVCLASGRPLRGGLLLSAAVVVKPYAVLFAPWLLTRRDRRPLAAMTAGLAAAFLAPAARYGLRGAVELHRQWWHTVSATTAPNLLNPDNVSLAAMFTRWFGADSNAGLLAAAAAIGLAVLVGIVIAGRGTLERTDTLEAGLILIAIPLVSPQGWDYVLLIATPAVMLLINQYGAIARGLRPAAAAALAVTALAIYDVMGRAAYAEFMALSAITLCALVEFAALVSLRFTRAA